MFKPLFDNAEQCGQPNPLITLSRNLGQGNSMVTSTFEQAIQRLTTSNESAGDLLTKEYLSNTAQPLMPSNTFDMRKMLAQLPVNDQRQFARKAMMERDWAKAQSNRQADVFAQGWTEQFMHGQQQKQDGLSQKWTDEFELTQQNTQMENIWKNTSQNSVWAKDFLEQFDLYGKATTTHNDLADTWQHEFLNHFTNEKEIHTENTPFFDYESVWDAIRQREAQQRYQFLENNPFLGEENSLKLANETLGQGRLSDSILHYEAALQNDPKNIETWYLLGLALAENEQDPRAISAFRNVLTLDPHNEKAILALAVSLTNESFDHLALHELRKWIYAHHGQQFPEQNDQNTTYYNHYEQLNRVEFSMVERQFLEAARSVQQVDPNLQNALSVLYNLGKDYDRAIDCLNAALTICPEDPILWNRLGATLANADRSSEAISAYKRALQLSPCYVRARYNLGIACMNLNSYRDSAAHFVAALQLQHSSNQSLIWSKLRSALIRIDSPNLGQGIMDALDKRDLTQILHHLQNL